MLILAQFQDLNIPNIEEMMSAVEQKLESLIKENTELKNQQIELISDTKSKDLQLQTSQSELEKHKKQIEQLVAQKEELEIKIKQKAEELENKDKSLELVQKELSNKGIELQEVKGLLRSKEMEWQNKENQFKELLQKLQQDLTTQQKQWKSKENGWNQKEKELLESQQMESAITSNNEISAHQKKELQMANTLTSNTIEKKEAQVTLPRDEEVKVKELEQLIDDNNSSISNIPQLNDRLKSLLIKYRNERNALAKTIESNMPIIAELQQELRKLRNTTDIIQQKKHRSRGSVVSLFLSSPTVVSLCTITSIVCYFLYRNFGACCSCNTQLWPT